MSLLNIKKTGQAVVGGILITVLLIAIVIFIFFIIRSPKEPPSPSSTELSGLSPEELQEAEAEIKATETKYGLSEVLPYGGPFYGEPFVINNPEDGGKILIEIDDSVDFDLAKGKALDWVQNQGYNPSDYNIEFTTANFPK